jgi:hypothetical protein
MEVPAKRARLAPRDLKLLDLDDDVLMMIINKLDHKSKLQMMASCKRFEGLIGQTHQFYKNFKFRLDQQKFLKTEETRYLDKIRRRFGIVEISSGTDSYSYRQKSLKSPILEFFSKVGADILKIKLAKLFFFKSDFCRLMKFLPKTAELEIKGLQFCTESDPEEIFEDFKLQHLTTLEISQSTNLDFFAAFVPSSLKILKLIQTNNKLWVAELLGKQKDLKELNLEDCKIDDFKFDPENCHIEKLEICGLEFQNESAFEKFSDFMKIQESVTEFKLFINKKELTKPNRNYSGALTNLLSLKSLKKFTFGCYNDELILEVLSNLKVCNPVVETLIIIDPPHEGADLTSLPKLFPYITDLKITWKDFYFYRDYPYFVDLQPINSMKMIRKLEIEYASDEMLAQLTLKELREFHLKKIASTDGEEDEFSLENWTTFINNNCQLEVLHMSECKMSVEQLQVTMENLPLLKSLEFTVYGCDWLFFLRILNSAEEYKKDQAEKTAKLIGENYDRLEHLKLEFDDDLIRTTILNYLESHYRGVKLNK